MTALKSHTEEHGKTEKEMAENQIRKTLHLCRRSAPKTGGGERYLWTETCPAKVW